jgi:L-fucose mutarotase
MLKGIPGAIGPDLLKALMEMGHGDEIVIADGNFPAASNAKRLLRSDGLNVVDLLDPILQLFPLDTFENSPVILMEVVKTDKYNPIIWQEFRATVGKFFQEFEDFEYLDRREFYKRAKEAYAIVATSETQRYANIILRKGIL